MVDNKLAADAIIACINFMNVICNYYKINTWEHTNSFKRFGICLLLIVVGFLGISEIIYFLLYILIKINK